MKTWFAGFIAVIAVTSAAEAFADPFAQIGEISLAGSGCPSGSARAVLTSDQTQLSVLFDRFNGEVGGNSGASEQHLVCALSFPVTLPPGFALSVVGLEFRGFASISKGARAEFRSSHAFTKKNGKSKVESRVDRFKGPFESDFDYVQALGKKWDSDCGGVVRFEANVELTLENNKKKSEGGTLSLDSVDTSTAPLSYRIELVKCK